MKIVLLSGLCSIHTIRWANGLADAGLEIHVISLADLPLTDQINSNVIVHMLPYKRNLGYFKMVPAVKTLLKLIKPDLVNAHYASGYGTTATLVNFKPTLLSVWGSDVYDFPYTSLLHKYIVIQNLKAATAIASTSHCMAEQTRKLLPSLNNIAITPFGVDINQFSQVVPIKPTNQGKIVIGTVKKLTSKYGIDTLIEAFNLLYNDLKQTDVGIANKLELRLVGGGEQTNELRLLAQNLGIADKVNFVGQVAHNSVPDELGKLDIYVALSRSESESFGVAIIEAGATGRPVVVSDAGGLPEVTIDNKTGLIVPRENPKLAAEALKKLVLNPNLRYELAINGRQHVADNYSWDKCIEKMIQVYENTIDAYRLAK